MKNQFAISLWPPAIYLVLAVLFVLIGYVSGVVNEPTVFSRSGSLAVLFGAAAEYHLLKREMRTLYDKIRDKSKIWLDDGYGDLPPRGAHDRLSKASHLVVIFGTLIWGSGDAMVAAI